MKRDNLSRSVITERYQLIRYFDQGRTVDYPVDVHPQTFANHQQRCKTKGTRPFHQLFNIQKDPYQLQDIGNRKENKKTVKALSKKLLAWMKKVNDPLLAGPLRTPYYDRAIADFKKTSD
jgi:N-sulfoglucosamine sulfohydrolase